MNRLIASLLSLMPTLTPSTATPAAQDKTVAAGNTAFGCDLYGQLRREQGNVFFSPFSISTALAMTAAGAEGETLAEMAKVLHLPGQSTAHAEFAGLIHDGLRH